jgi:hypothetical protein
VDPAQPLAAWVGTWQQYDNKIVLTRNGDQLSANGEAYWPGKSIMPANEGGFSGTAAPSGRRLHFAGDGPHPCSHISAAIGSGVITVRAPTIAP